jgi:predicted transglutaminase-like cysteine proteinase
VVDSFNTLVQRVLALGLGLTAAACASMPEPSVSMALGAQAAAPHGFVAFCARQPTDCVASEDELARLQAADRATLAAVQLSSLTYDWGRVFGSAQTSRPTAAVAAPAVATPALAIRYDWSQVFAKQLGASTSAELVATPLEAREPAAAPKKLELTSKSWALITRTNDQVNRAIAQRPDLEAYGVPELWSTPIEAGQRYGDCEDYVLEKRRALIAAGLPREALSIAVVNTVKGESHAVLLVETAAGAYVLDNLTPWVLPWTKTAYQWRERQVAGSAANWAMAAGVKLEPAASRLLLASLP